MTEIDPRKKTETIGPDILRDTLRRLDRRQWWLWSSTVLVLFLLTVAVASFAFSAMLSWEQNAYSFYLNQSVRALIGIVLLFSVYLVYQQTTIGRMRNQMAEQIQSLAKVESVSNEVYNLAALDQLTGLYNRRSGEQRLMQEIARTARTEKPLTVLLLNLDRLKRVNDERGHAAGDALLKGFSERVRRSIRGFDIASRLGGDEFMVILPECRSDEVRFVLGRMEGLDVNHAGEKIACPFSRGWTDYRPGETQDEFLKRATDALRRNKRDAQQKREAPPQNPVPQFIA